MLQVLATFEILRVACALTCHHVSAHSLRNQQGIDCYDFSELEFTDQERKIVVATNIPNEIWLTVSDLQVDLEITDRVVGSRRFRSFFGGTHGDVEL
jgi:hypothetical protein